MFSPSFPATVLAPKRFLRAKCFLEKKGCPLVDGNGRIGRVLNNYLLIREGHVPINIKFIDRRLYYDAFVAFDARGDTAIMEEIVGKALSNSYHKRLAYLEEKKSSLWQITPNKKRPLIPICLTKQAVKR